jgi:hypothetical protein
MKQKDKILGVFFQGQEKDKFCRIFLSELHWERNTRTKEKNKVLGLL